MEDIKFRIWDTSFQEMCDVSSVYFPPKIADGINKKIPKGSPIVEGHGISGNGYRDIVVTNANPLLQYSGAKDKKGHPIYKHDILKEEIETEYGKESINHVVEFIAGAFYPVCMRPSETLEIIGNIYANPEIGITE
jgi:hypothetical protein